MSQKDVYYASVAPSSNANFGCVHAKEVARSGDVVLYAVSVNDEVFVNELSVLYSRGFVRNGKFFSFGESAVAAIWNLCRFCDEEVDRTESVLSLYRDMGASAQWLRRKICTGEEQ